MSVELKDLEVGSIVVDCTDSIGIVLETNRTPTYPIVYAKKASGSRYKARPSDFKAVIGKGDINAFNGATAASTGRSEATDAFDAMFMPEPLKSMGLKIGDKINIRHGYGTSVAIYGGYKPSRPINPVSFTIDGRRYKGSVSLIISKAA